MAKIPRDTPAATCNGRWRARVWRRLSGRGTDRSAALRREDPRPPLLSAGGGLIAAAAPPGAAPPLPVPTSPGPSLPPPAAATGSSGGGSGKRGETGRDRVLCLPPLPASGGALGYPFSVSVCCYRCCVCVHQVTQPSGKTLLGLD